MNKGFTYIITTMIIIILITSAFLIFNPTTKSTKTTQQTLAKNYEIEFLNLTISNPSITDINNLNYDFKKFINSNNYDSKICNIVKTDSQVYFSNFTENDCNLMVDGNFNQTISDNDTIAVDIDTFINNTNIYLCSCNYESGKNVYYIDIYDESTKIILKN